MRNPLENEETAFRFVLGTIVGGEVAGHRVALATVDEGGLLDGTDLLRLPAPRAEAAARRRVHRARDVPGQQYAFPLRPVPTIRIRHRDGRQQRLRIGMPAPPC